MPTRYFKIRFFFINQWSRYNKLPKLLLWTSTKLIYMLCEPQLTFPNHLHSITTRRSTVYTQYFCFWQCCSKSRSICPGSLHLNLVLTVGPTRCNVVVGLLCSASAVGPGHCTWFIRNFSTSHNAIQPRRCQHVRWDINVSRIRDVTWCCYISVPTVEMLCIARNAYTCKPSGRSTTFSGTKYTIIFLKHQQITKITEYNRITCSHIKVVDTYHILQLYLHWKLTQIGTHNYGEWCVLRQLRKSNAGGLCGAR